MNMDYYFVVGSFILVIILYYASLNRKILKIFYYAFFDIKISEFKESYLYGKDIKGNLKFISKRRNQFPIRVSLELRKRFNSVSAEGGSAYGYSEILYKTGQEYNIDLDAGEKRDIDFILKIPKISEFSAEVQEILSNKLVLGSNLFAGVSYYWDISIRVKKFGYVLRYYDWQVELFENLEQKEKLFKRYSSDVNSNVSFVRYIKLIFIAMISFILLMILGFYLITGGKW